MPATIMSTAKPMSPRKLIVGLFAWISPAPVFPNAIPASSSPTTTGMTIRSDAARSGPPKPARMITASCPKLGIERPQAQ